MRADLGSVLQSEAYLPGPSVRGAQRFHLQAFCVDKSSGLLVGLADHGDRPIGP